MLFDDLPPSMAMLRFANISLVSFAVHAVAELGIADLLANGPQSPDDLARATNTHADSLYRLLRALAAIEVFAEDEQGRFGLTPRAETLRSDVPGSVRHAILHIGSTEQVQARAGLLSSIRTGKPAFNDAYDGRSWWEYLGQNPAADAVFNRAMTSLSQRVTTLASEYDFGPIRTLIDVGGGQGALLAAILQTYPTMRGILFDLPHVVAEAMPALATAGVSDRCTIVGGSFFESIPDGADAYLLRSIIHDWNDDDARRILMTCRRAMSAQSRLLLVEMVLRPANEPEWSKIQDLSMLTLVGGKERTAEEFRILFASAGLTLSRIVSTSAIQSVVEAVPTE